MRETARFAILMLLASATLAVAEGTQQWTESSYADFEKGTAHNVAVRSDGRIEAAPSLVTRWTSESAYLWSLDADAKGRSCVGTGAASGGSNLICLGGDAKPAMHAHFAELGVQSVRMLLDGSVLAATAPDGKVYRVAADGSQTVFFDPSKTAEKPRYLWAMALDGDSVLIAAGLPATLYRVPLHGGAATLVFHSGDQHLRSLLRAPDGTVYVGSDGAGVVYRIGRDGKPFALYTAARREITSMALDRVGVLYVAAVGAKTPAPLPPLPTNGQAVVALQSVSASSATTNSVVPDGSEIDRIQQDGTPLRMVTLREDVVYALGMRDGRLLAGTGNHGRVLSIDVNVPGAYTDLGHTDAAQASAFAPVRDGLLIATSNTGKLAFLSDALSSDATFTSDVFDAQNFAIWGRVEQQPGSPDAPPAKIEMRSGNVENPNGNGETLWSAWLTSPPPPARFVQWRAMLPEHGTLTSVTVNYLPKNLPPQIEAIVVQPGARIAPSSPQVSTTLPITFAQRSDAPQGSQNDPPVVIAQRDRTSVTARWQARDENGDDLLFAVYFRDVHEHAWHLIKDKVSDHYLAFDASLLPDGDYVVRVTATDAPSNTERNALTAERESDPFTIDTTAPVLENLAAKIEGGKIHATFAAHDATSVIHHAEFSVDGGAWQYLEPVGQISDAKDERYDFTAAVNGNGEHVIAVRVTDRHENAGTLKAILR